MLQIIAGPVGVATTDARHGDEVYSGRLLGALSTAADRVKSSWVRSRLSATECQLRWLRGAPLVDFVGFPTDAFHPYHLKKGMWLKTPGVRELPVA